MRIGIVNSTVFPCPPSGYAGLEMVVYQRCVGLRDLGHHVLLFAPAGSEVPGCDLFAFGPPGIHEEAAYNNYWKHLIGCDVIIDDSWLKCSYRLKAEGRLQAPVLGVMHAPVNTMYQTPPPVPKPCTVTISRDQQSHYEGLFNQPARTAYNGVDVDYYRPMTVTRTDRALFLARFSEIKGADLAIDACREVGVGLDLVGDTTITNEPAYFHKCAAACDGTQIRMLGGETRGGTVLRYSRAKFMIHANKRFREPFGLAPVEAQLCGLPVIAWDNGAMRETVKPVETGVLVRSEQELLDAVREFARTDLSPALRAKCREWASQFSVQAMAKRYAELCEEALNTGGW